MGGGAGWRIFVLEKKRGGFKKKVKGGKIKKKKKKKKKKGGSTVKTPSVVKSVFHLIERFSSI